MNRMSDLISRQDVLHELDGCDYELKDWQRWKLKTMVRDIPSAQSEQNNHTVACLHAAEAFPEWNNHTVACLLAEVFDDTCACNHNGIDEWLPEKCELLDSCPHPAGVACWEQFLKHKAERRTDE